MAALAPVIICVLYFIVSACSDALMAAQLNGGGGACLYRGKEYGEKSIEDECHWTLLRSQRH